MTQRKKQSLSDFDKAIIKEIAPEIAKIIIAKYEAMLADRWFRDTFDKMDSR